MKWTEEQLETMWSMVLGGASAAEIGRTIGCSRNAVIGAAHRNGITLACPSSDPGRLGRKPRRRSARKMALKKFPVKQTAPPAPPEPCSLVELTNYSCRWPHGEPHLPGFYFCGAVEADLNAGVPYCRAHAAIAFNPRDRA